MNILLTNDDGVDSPGLLILADALKARSRHRVFILAPDSDRSGVSHGLSILRQPLKLAEKRKDVWHCAGLPADCALISILGGFPCRPDLVIAGINAGCNIGNDIIYSGTCAAARQAVLLGVPGIALSLSERGGAFLWESAAAWAAEHLEDFLSLWREDVFINVNIPNVPSPAGMANTWPALKNYNDAVSAYDDPDGSKVFSLAMGRETAEDEGGSDYDVIAKNLVSASPVCVYPVVRRDLCAGVPDYAAAGERRIKKNLSAGV